MHHHLFSPAGELALGRILPRRPLLALDFDGTLTPIVARPEAARLSAAVSSRLALLDEHLPVAIVTGRSRADVRGRLGFTPSYIVGNHGAEDDRGDASTLNSPEGPPGLQVMRARLRGAAPMLAAVGVTVEDKGHSLALHYRLSRTREDALRAIGELLTDLGDDLRVFGGKMVVNVVPRAAPDKADAVRALVARSGASCAIFAGDDVNDEPVFATAPIDWLTIRVGRDDPQSRARFFLDSPGEMAMLLERMVVLLAPR